MLEELKDIITSMREFGDEELFEAMRKMVDDAKSDFDKIIEGMNDEDIVNNLRGKLGTLTLLNIIVAERAGCQDKAETDRVFDALPDIISNFEMV